MSSGPAQDSSLGEDPLTGIADAGYRVAFEIDDFDMAARGGMERFVFGPAHHLDPTAERAPALATG